MPFTVAPGAALFGAVPCRGSENEEEIWVDLTPPAVEISLIPPGFLDPSETGPIVLPVLPVVFTVASMRTPGRARSISRASETLASAIG